MPPVAYVSCEDLSIITTVPPNGTTIGRKGTEESDLQALLYIVITLLFYSLGIIIGIISYLKREKREMLEDKTYDDFFTMKLDPFLAVRSRRVQQFAERIKLLEERKRLREEEAERARNLKMNEGSIEGSNSRRVSRVSLIPTDNISMQFKHKSCQTDDIEKETSTLGHRARKIVKILTPTPSRNPRTLKIHLPRTSKKKAKHKESSKVDNTLSSPSLPDDDQLSFVSVNSARPRSTSLLTPTICLPSEDMMSQSTMSDSPTSDRHIRSPVPYIDASTDEDGDRATTPLIHEVGIQ